MVDMDPRVRQKFSALSSLRNVPEIFYFSFIMRRSRSAWLLVKGTVNCSFSELLLEATEIIGSLRTGRSRGATGAVAGYAGGGGSGGSDIWFDYIPMKMGVFARV